VANGELSLRASGAGIPQRIYSAEHVR